MDVLAGSDRMCDLACERLKILACMCGQFQYTDTLEGHGHTHTQAGSYTHSGAHALSWKTWKSPATQSTYAMSEGMNQLKGYVTEFVSFMKCEQRNQGRNQGEYTTP